MRLAAFVPMLGAGLSAAQIVGMPTEQWLAEAKPVIVRSHCEYPQAGYRDVHRSSLRNCLVAVGELFDLCATEEIELSVPIVSLDELRSLGPLISRCVGAQYSGGASLAEFRSSQRAAAAEASSAPSSRELADAVADAIVSFADDAVFEQFAPSLRDAYTRDELMRPLATIRDRRLRIVARDYRRAVEGQTLFLTRLVAHTTHWYAVDTDPEELQAFLTIKITTEQQRPYLAGFELLSVDGQLPSFLQPRND